MKLKTFTKQNAGSIALLIMVGCGKTRDTTNDSMVKSQAKPDRIVCYSYSAKDNGYLDSEPRPDSGSWFTDSGFVNPDSLTGYISSTLGLTFAHKSR